MPKIVRSMREKAGKPLIGPRDLGVRVPPDESPDISADGAGNVAPGTGGMSVSPSLNDLPESRVPKRLRHLRPLARGSNEFRIWSMGTGSFVAEKVADNLALRLDPARPSEHGFAEPDRPMALMDYIAALEATRDDWKIDEG